mmetsp:Transcript_31103/g.50321  ORF Transcript_31103/g.50321 Transcript_31103/m.50321 type:complete len:450 (-) Transcript_31103:292-1641(-)|eukprot:CAMPEP_0184349380 /NCGR_PEP_ID=MMETSP1089-20130417/32360_1 /TAXON_ID=38269 ORGANISM="Gloeochaete wittrockiana, Strain SAG46.84" /NCGR_SAMPLE_ID=MMETSP1089 /ASSEMBLY_ACC=CAM_ASM_000445 /LENGTH=449 /DNA_ID=CAMNT_0026681539 /DNA_START=69 /DNA_END=1418 /DNA_ORIENTATION=-
MRIIVPGSRVPSQQSHDVLQGSDRSEDAGSHDVAARHISSSASDTLESLGNTASVRVDASSASRSPSPTRGYNSEDEHSGVVRKPYPTGQSRNKHENVHETQLVPDREPKFEEDLKRCGLLLRRMTEDGNCLFRAIADQIYGDPSMHEAVRKLCCDYMERNRDHFSQFVTEDFREYVRRKRQDRCFGNHIEMQAMAEMYNRPIHVYAYNTQPINIFHGAYSTNEPPLRLSYHANNHYNSVIDPNAATVGVGLGLPSYKPGLADKLALGAAFHASEEKEVDQSYFEESRKLSDLEATEFEIEKAVLAASRAEALERLPCRSHRSDEDDSVGLQRPYVKSSQSYLKRVPSPSTPNPGAPRPRSPRESPAVQSLANMGFPWLRIVEAYATFGENFDDMLSYVLCENIDDLSLSMHKRALFSSGSNGASSSSSSKAPSSSSASSSHSWREPKR